MCGGTSVTSCGGRSGAASAARICTTGMAAMRQSPGADTVAAGRGFGGAPVRLLNCSFASECAILHWNWLDDSPQTFRRAHTVHCGAAATLLVEWRLKRSLSAAESTQGQLPITRLLSTNQIESGALPGARRGVKCGVQRVACTHSRLLVLSWCGTRTKRPSGAGPQDGDR